MPYDSSRKRARSSSVHSAYKKPRSSRRSTYRAARSARRTTTVIHKSSGELKGIDQAIDPIANDAGGTGIKNTTNTNDAISVVNLIDPGSASYNRIGRKIHMRSIRYKGILQTTFKHKPTSGELEANTVRIVLVYDKQPSDALPNYNAIFGRTIQDGTESTQFLDNLRYDNTGRFKVLADDLFSMNPKASNQVGGTDDSLIYYTTFDKYVDLKNKVTVYSGQSIPCTIADISTGALYLIYRARNDDNEKSESFVRNGVIRLRYTDM